MRQNDKLRQKTEKDEVEQMLMQWENEWTESLMTRDPAVMERILAEDFFYTIQGQVFDKNGFIQRCVDDPITYTSWYSLRIRHRTDARPEHN